VQNQGKPGQLPLWIILVIIALLVTNLHMVISLRGVSRAVDTLPKQFYQETGLLRERIGEISRSVHSMEQEAAWYDPPLIEVDRDDRETPGTIHVSWSFRELSRGAEVGLHYRMYGEEGWRKAPVAAESALSFSARIPLPEPLEPVLEIEYRGLQDEHWRSSRIQGTSTREGELRMEYVISATDEVGHRSGGREHLSLGRWATILLGSIVEVDPHRRFNVTLVDRGPFDSKALWQLSAVYFAVQEKDGQVYREPLQLQPGEEMWEAVVHFDEPPEIESVGFVVVSEYGKETESLIPLR